MLGKKEGDVNDDFTVAKIETSGINAN